MSEYDRRVAIIETLCKFCPVCAAELVWVARQVDSRLSLTSRKPIVSYTVRDKRCPNGHGILDACMAEGNAGPGAFFELTEQMFVELPSE